MNYKNTILFIVGIMYVLHTYAMKDNRDDNGEHLLDFSFYATPDNIKLLKDMLAHNIDPNMQDTNGSTPLQLTVLQHNSEYVSILLAARADPNKRNNYRDTPLHNASVKQQCESIQLLLKAKANPNLVDAYKDTPLHYTITTHVSMRTVELLLSGNASPNLKNIAGNTPLHKAANCSHIPEMIKTAQLLLQYGAQVDIVNNQHYTPLQLLTTYISTPSRRKMGRLFVWHYILLRDFAKLVPEIIPETAIACAIASQLALHLAEEPTIWSKKLSTYSCIYM